MLNTIETRDIESKMYSGTKNNLLAKPSIPITRAVARTNSKKAEWKQITTFLKPLLLSWYQNAKDTPQLSKQYAKARKRSLTPDRWSVIIGSLEH